MNNDGFTKLFSSIITSSIWSEDDKTRIMWVTILAITDQHGFCSAALPGLAAMARMSIEDAEKCIAKLESADKHSRTVEFEGRRIEKVDGGWLVLNHGKYRDKERAEKRNEYMKNYMRDKRNNANKVNEGLTGANSSASVSASASVPESGGDCKGEIPIAEEKLAYGEFLNVGLTLAEYVKLEKVHGKEALDRGIEVLGNYLKSCPKKKYASHYAVLKKDSWVWEKLNKQPGFRQAPRNCI